MSTKLTGMELIRAQRGLPQWLAARLNLTQPAVSQWSVVPAERVVEIERLTGIPRHLLRPDLWLAPWRDPPRVPHRAKAIKQAKQMAS